jgi:nitrogen fixation protein FixH
VNLLMAYQAISTFPGLEVKNSYVASQKFDERNARKRPWAGRSRPNMTRRARA